MGLAKSTTCYTVDQYLTFERAAQGRHYYVDGETYAMAGESGAHGDISVNVVVALANQLKGSPCRVRTKDTKVRSGPILSALGDRWRARISRCLQGCCAQSQGHHGSAFRKHGSL